MAHISNRELSDIAAEVRGGHQCGFMLGRVFWDNVMELDTYLRMYAIGLYVLA